MPTKQTNWLRIISDNQIESVMPAEEKDSQETSADNTAAARAKNKKTEKPPPSHRQAEASEEETTTASTDSGSSPDRRPSMLTMPHCARIAPGLTLPVNLLTKVH